MLNFPTKTQFGKRIPKGKFYEHLPVNTDLKRLFIDQIQTITWSYKLAPETLAVEKGKYVAEIQVFTIRLNSGELDDRLLYLIDRGIPYHILYILENVKNPGKIQLRIGFKEQHKVYRYYETDWQSSEELLISLHGLDMDVLYDHLVRQIAGDKLNGSETSDLKEAVERQLAAAKLEKRIASLEKKRDNEKQLNRQVEINAEIRKLKQQIEELKNG